MQAPTIIVYNKTEKCKLDEGYNIRPFDPWKSIVIHTTNGDVGTAFENEAIFLQESKKVGAHYLVSKDNRIAQIVPLTHQAYHAGWVRNPMYSNKFSIGIEVHFTPKEGRWTLVQLHALTWLVRTLPRVPLVTHRFAAIPPGRKIDPSGLSDTFFNLWRNNIDKSFVEIRTEYNANVRKGTSLRDSRLRVLAKGNYAFALKVTGDSVFNSNVWYQIGENEFIHSSAVIETDTEDA